MNVNTVRRDRAARLRVLQDRVLYGAAYYPEYLPSERLKTDLDLIAEASLSVVRVGESVWSTWEPEEGSFDTDWMHPVLDGLHERGVAAVFGTPTYAVPPWFAGRYPEAMAQRRTGASIPYGGRQDADFTAPAFRYCAERVIRRLVSEFAGHPAVIGWQVDNETGIEILHNPSVFAAFVTDLRHRYGDVGALNEAWGLTYWSHRIADWSELWVPDGNTVPGYDLDWRRFQARLTTDFLSWQADIVTELGRPDQFVTTCLVGGYGRTTADAAAIGAQLDIVGVNPYYPMQDALAIPHDGSGADTRPQWMHSSGAWWIHLQADMAYGATQGPFLVTETDAGGIGDAHTTFPPYDGQLRQAALALIARGARMVEYWHWHTCHFGHEDHWIGVLGHSLEPGRIYREVATIGAELAGAGVELGSLEPDADVAVLVSPESQWAMEFHPPLARTGSREGDPTSYAGIVDAFYRGFFDAGAQQRILHPRHLDGLDPARHPVLVVPALYVAPDALLQQLADYAHAGGHLVLGFRAGYADEHVRMRAEVAPPGPLRSAAGVSYTEFSNLAAPVPVTAPPGGLSLGGGAHGTGWAEGLELGDAQVLAGYDHPHFGRFPAVTTHPHGAGRVTYVGTLPDVELGRALAAWVLATAGVGGPWAEEAASVTRTSARTAAGPRVHFLSNWGWQPATVRPPTASRDLFSGEPLPAGAAVQLGPWDVRVLVEQDSGVEQDSEVKQ